MNTPIYNFVARYNALRPARFHMPGHKGRGSLGCEEGDITEIPGADSLYEADGIIAESEANASRLFGCPTFYSTEGSSHCIRAMLQLAMQLQSVGGGVHDAPNVSVFGSCGTSRTPSPTKNGGRFCILAARNVHKTFLSAAALLDLDVVWLPSAGGSYLSAQPSPAGLDAALTESGAAAVYLTCPDYLGFLPDLRPLAELCHAHGALLLVDNAHGAYLRFLTPSRHPMDLGADLCCDSAHKTLPVLTGGAYLHVAERLAGAAKTSPACRGEEPAARPVEGVRPHKATGFEMQHEAVRDALALFGSTSPSYLILQSLDLANPYLETLPETLAAFLPKVEALKTRLRAAGWRLVGDEPLKLTLSLAAANPSPACRGGEPAVTPVDKTSPACRGGGSAARPVEGSRPSLRFPSGTALASALAQTGIYCEFFDADYLVCMLSPENSEEELARLEAAFSELAAGYGRTLCAPTDSTSSVIRLAGDGGCHLPLKGKATVCSLRDAMLAPAVTIPAAESLGQVLARPGVSCPPAVPILMPGERIDAAAVSAFARYGIEYVSVLP